MAPCSRSKLHPRQTRQKSTIFKKKTLKVIVGVPKASIQDILINCQNAPKAIIDEDDEEISFNLKEGTPILIKKIETTRKRKTPEENGNDPMIYFPVQKKCKINLSEGESIEMIKDFVDKSCKISLPEEESIEKIKDFVEKSCKISLSEEESIEKIKDFVEKSCKIQPSTESCTTMTKVENKSIKNDHAWIHDEFHDESSNSSMKLCLSEDSYYSED